MYTLHCGDCLEVMRGMAANSVDTVVTDPPYGLSFMGKNWDHGVPGAAFWAEALRVAKPGAMLLAFGGTRTFHRLTVAIEDAGWEVRDCLMWLYGSGFPKSLNIALAIDKADGAIGDRGKAFRTAGAGDRKDIQNANGKAGMAYTAPATPDAQTWDGWGTSLKPAFEPVIVASKPLRTMGDCAIIIRNLSHMEAELCEQIASLAVKSSRPTPHGLNGAKGDSVLTLVPTQAGGVQEKRTAIGAGDGINSEAVISELTPETVHTALSTISLWKHTLEEGLHLASMCTTSTASSLTTDLITWSLSLSRLTLNDIIQGVLNPSGLSVHVSNAAQYFSVVNMKLNAIQELIAQGLVSGPSERHPAWEPVIMAMKPLDGTFADNAQRWGVAGLNVDGGRIGYEPDDMASRIARTGQHAGESYGHSGNVRYSGGEVAPVNPAGRWPANLLLDEDAAAALDAQSGERPSAGKYKSIENGLNIDTAHVAYGDYKPVPYKNHYAGDTGGASRFFYVAKASRAERNAGLEGMEARYQLRNDLAPEQQAYVMGELQRLGIA